MKRLTELRFALRLLTRDLRAGEVSLLAAAVVIAVASVTAVDFFTDRVHRALILNANQLLGADLVIRADRPLPAEFGAEARRDNLETTQTLRFPSMVVRGDKNALSRIEAVNRGYPLRGVLRIADTLYGSDRPAVSIPAPGTAWLDERLFTELNLAIGDSVEVGSIKLKVTAILTQDPGSSLGFISAGRRLIMNGTDIRATGLIQPGSRIGYRLQIAGPLEKIEKYRRWATGRLRRGQRIEGIQDARPEIRSALDRAEKFLSLAALVSVVLAAVAISLAARRFLQRHLDGCAMMRCLGARQKTVLQLYLAHFAFLGLIASGAGCLLGAAAQYALANWLGQFVTVQLPPPGVLPAVHGLLAGVALLLGFALPPIAGLGTVPTLRVLRRELGLPGGKGLAGYVLGVAVIAGMILWKAHDATLGMLVLGGLAGAVLGAVAVTWSLLRLLAGLKHGDVGWRFGVVNLRRRVWGSIVQIVALGIGMMALLTLTLTRGDLLRTWQASLPPNAPNRFIVNIQHDQLKALGGFLAAHDMAQPVLLPMVRGRLVRINHRRVSSADYAGDRAKHLIDREFNLSWARTLQSDNKIVAGRWWGDANEQRHQLSVESGIAETLGIRLGDVLTFDIGGNHVAATVTSLRKVDWDTFNVNFFVIAPPGLLDGFPVSYITSFYLPPRNAGLLNALIKEFPNFLLIDVAQIMAQVRKMMDQVANAVQFVFLFTLMAGLVVLYAAIAGTQDERLYRTTIMRTLGASRGQLTRANLAEFAIIGALAGLIGAAGANALGFLLAIRVLHLDYAFNAEVLAFGVVCGTVGVAIAGHLGTRRVLNVSPLGVLREFC